MKKSKVLFLWVLPFVLVLGIGLGMVNPVRAVEFDEDGVVSRDEVIEDDLFIANDTVEINGSVSGDVFAAAGAVKVDGDVDGSLFTGAQTIIINGDVAGSIYAGASNLTLDRQATVGRNLYFAGFNLTTTKDSRIGRDLLVGAYQALLSGRVERDIHAGVGALEIEGTVGGDVYAEVGSTEDTTRQTFFFGGPPGVETIVPTGIRVSKDANIGGKLTYKSSEEQDQAIKSKPAGGIDFQYEPKPTDQKKGRDVGVVALIGSWFIKRLRVLITLLVLGGLALWQMPALLERGSQTVQDEIGPTFGWGLVTIIVVYVGAAILAGLIIALGIFFGVITLGGLSKTIFALGFSSLGLALALFGLIVSYISKLVVSFTAGKLILERISPPSAKRQGWPLIFGVLLYAFLRAIPILGWWIGAVVTIIGVGALWMIYRDRQLQPAPETI